MLNITKEITFFHKQKEPGCNKKLIFTANASTNKRERFAADQLLLENDYHLFRNSSLTHFVLIRETRKRDVIINFQLIGVATSNFSFQ